MASVQLQVATGVPYSVLGTPQNIVRTGSRLWVALGTGTTASFAGVQLYYSDDDLGARRR
jgi:hypothetical protein